jgi:carbamoyl-phosphate synthase large subunit
MAHKIAITGAGGGVGQSIIKSLYNTDYDIIALDGETLATGLYAVPNSYLIPFVNKPDYISVLLGICKKEGISLLFPGLDAELETLSLNVDAFKAIGTTVIVSNPNVIKLSNDKQYMYDSLDRNVAGKFPFTFPLSQAKNVEFPVIIKQMVGGARSQNVFLVKDKTELKLILAKIGDNIDNFILQEYIEGDEYTCGTINLNNECKGVIVMRRILRDGDTYKCFSEHNIVIEKCVKNIADTIKPFGACNIQLRVRNGVPFIIEINARCSGTTAARTLCGFNEPKMIADFILKGKEPEFDIKPLTILRYWNELVVSNTAISSLQRQGELKGSTIQL